MAYVGFFCLLFAGLAALLKALVATRLLLGFGGSPRDVWYPAVLIVVAFALIAISVVNAPFYIVPR